MDLQNIQQEQQQQQQTRNDHQTQHTAIVTGSTRGIGKETALLLLKNGINVIISSSDQENVDHMIQEIHERFPSRKDNILGLKCDVSKYSEVKNLVDKTMKRFGMIDILVNNAGIVSYNNIIDTTEEEWNKTSDINLKDFFYLRSYTYY